MKNVLIAPLDWGLGHATRCIPIINELLKQGAQVFIAADNRPYDLLKEEFPHVPLIRLPGYDIKYSKSGNMIGAMIKSTPGIIKGIKKEHEKIQTLIEEHHIDLLISDNRFGIYSKKIYSVFITHQIMIKAPFGESVLQKTNAKYIEKFNECWVPDNESSPNLSGDLSHKYQLNIPTSFIGPLTRFNTADKQVVPKKKLAVIISGPEPQRSIFEDLVFSQLKKLSLIGVIFRGIPGSSEQAKVEGFTIYNHADTDTFKNEISDCELVLARPGYTTIMDLSILGKKAIFVPTPGQTEQEYLAEYFAEKQFAVSSSQKDFNLDQLINSCDNIHAIPQLPTNNILKERIINLLK